MYIGQLPKAPVSADSLEKLAAKISVPEYALTSSVEDWHAFLSSLPPPNGKTHINTVPDPATGRVLFSPGRHRILKAPFYAGRMHTGASLTCGGFRTTKSMQIVHAIDGKPIPGLFAAGDVSGGFTVTADVGGTHLGGGIVLGWATGEAAAKGQFSEPHTECDFQKSLPARLAEKRSAREGIVNGVQRSQATPNGKVES